MNEMINPKRLFTEQLEEFGLARDNYANLKKAVYRTLLFPDFSLILQYNPDRIRSTAASTDPQTLKKRACFLCPENLPPFQKGIPYGEHYRIFVNPYPIFSEHFTVPSREHCPQRIRDRFPDMLSLAKDFPEYTVFYNGPCCGASAPDHFHFQMALRNIMPVEKEAGNLRPLLSESRYTLGTIPRYLRKNILLKSSDACLLGLLFEKLCISLKDYIPSDPEPMFNLLAWYAAGEWTVVVFPRRRLRPWQFFAEKEEKILFSPGSVDFAGLLVTPRKEDFERYTPELLTSLFEQLTLTDDTWEHLQNRLRSLRVSL